MKDYNKIFATYIKDIKKLNKKLNSEKISNIDYFITRERFWQSAIGEASNLVDKELGKDR